MGAVATTLSGALFGTDATDQQEEACIYVAELMLNIRDLLQVQRQKLFKEESDQRAQLDTLPLARWIGRIVTPVPEAQVAEAPLSPFDPSFVKRS